MEVDVDVRDIGNSFSSVPDILRLYILYKSEAFMTVGSIVMVLSIIIHRY